MATTVQSRKQKGRRAQQECAKEIQEIFNLPEEDVKSNPMGSQGSDVWLSERARHVIGFDDIEVKNVEKFNIWAALEQAEERTCKPLVVFKRNRSDRYCALKFSDLLTIIKRGVDE